MINCLLTEFGWVGWENIWHSFITHDVIEHEKRKSVILFLMENVKLISVDSLKSLIYITRLITVKPRFLSLNGNPSLRNNRLIVFVNF